jgi:hypothetical protein
MDAPTSAQGRFDWAGMMTGSKMKGSGVSFLWALDWIDDERHSWKQIWSFCCFRTWSDMKDTLGMEYGIFCCFDTGIEDIVIVTVPQP